MHCQFVTLSTSVCPECGSFINSIFEVNVYFHSRKKYFKLMNILWPKGSLRFSFMLQITRKKEQFHALNYSKIFAIALKAK